MPANVFTANQLLVFAEIDTLLDNAFASGAVDVGAVQKLAPMAEWSQLSSILGVNYQHTVKDYLRAGLMALVQPFDPWHVVGAGGEPAFLGSAVNAGFGGDDLNPVGFCKDAFNRVTLRGLCKPNTGIDGGDLFRLPAKYWPTNRETHFCLGFSLGGYVTLRVDVGLDGSVGLFTPLDLGGYVSFDGYNYLAKP